MVWIFKSKAATQPLPKHKVDPAYKKLRRQVYIGIFVGYAGYYLVRKNFTIAMPGLLEEFDYSKAELGMTLAATSLAYGLSKFFMGSISDKSNPRFFMTAGLMMSALVLLLMSTNFVAGSILLMTFLYFMNGWVQGMGWPPSGKTMVHWFSHNERGKIVSFWNIAHNFGGAGMGILAAYGIVMYGHYFNPEEAWKGAMILPAFAAIFVAIFILITLRDTPQSEGLPPIEVWRNDIPPIYDAEDGEKELALKEIFFKHVLNNKILWTIAIANAFVYMVRYGVLDWAPTYLYEVKNYNIKQAGFAYSLYELAGIPGTILCGIASDYLFKSKRAPAGLLFMIPIVVFLAIYWLNSSGPIWIDLVSLFAIGFFIYGPVMLIGLYALELVNKKAAGTAAGFTGLFGYVAGTFAAGILVGYMVDIFGWDGGFLVIMIATNLAVLLFGLAWIMEERAVRRAKRLKDKLEAEAEV